MSSLRLTLAVLLAAGCQGFPAIQPCAEIPAGGCPSGRGGTCDDPTCDALYDCVGGEWARVQTCPMRDGGAGGAQGGSGAGGADAGDGDASDGDACTPVDIDVSNEAMDCTPDLEFPDCPAQAALGCAQTVCSTGCDTFYLCKNTSEGLGWVSVAYCTCEGQLVVQKTK